MQGRTILNKIIQEVFFQVMGRYQVYDCMSAKAHSERILGSKSESGIKMCFLIEYSLCVGYYVELRGWNKINQVTPLWSLYSR